MARNKKLINNAENHLVVGSIEVLGDISGGNMRTIKRNVENLQASYTRLSTRQKDYWSALSEDSIITPLEKIQLKKEWECIDLTYTTIYREAGNKNVMEASTIIAYINAYNNLRTFLFTTLQLFDEMSEETDIDDRDVFNTYFSNYYACENLVQTALILGTIEALDFITVDNLEDEGTENQVVIYSGELYQWVNGHWKKIGTNGYCGCLSNLPTEIDGNYFLAAENFIGPIFLVSPDWKYLIAPEGGRLSVSVTYERAYIYEYVNGGWNKVTDLNDYRYIVAFSDYYNLTGRLPEVWQSALDELAAGIDRLDQLTQAQGATIEAYKTQILGELDSQTASLQAQITAADGNLQTLTGRYDGLDEDLQRVLEDYYITDEETEELQAKYNFNQDELAALQQSVTDINGDLSDLSEALSGAQEILSNYTGDTDQLTADIQKILRDYYVTNQELDELQAKYNFSPAEYAALQQNFTSLNNKIGNVATALATLPARYDVTEQEVAAMLGNLTAAEFAELISQYGNDLDALSEALANKIEHIPVYLGLVQSLPYNAKPGDWFVWNGVANYLTHNYHPETLKRGWAYRREQDIEILPAVNYSWYEMNPQELNYSSYYMQALDDILSQTDVVASGSFGVLFAGAFFGHSASLDALKTKTITIADGGNIMTEGFTPNGETGFCLDGETGKAVFNDIEARGHIEATSGSFHGEIEAFSGTFYGNIQSGPFFVSNDDPSNDSYTLNLKTGPAQVTNTLKLFNWLNEQGYSLWSANHQNGKTTNGYVVTSFNGTIGGNAFTRIFFHNDSQAHGYFRFEKNDGTVVGSNYTFDTWAGNYASLPEIILNRYTPGKTFKLLYMPTTPGAAGCVYRDSENYLRISPYE